MENNTKADHQQAERGESAIAIDFRTKPYASGMLVATGLFLLITAISFATGLWFYITHDDNGFTLLNAQAILGHRILSLGMPWHGFLLKLLGGELTANQWIVIMILAVGINVAVLGTAIGLGYSVLARIFTHDRLEELGLIPMLGSFVLTLYGFIFVAANFKPAIIDLNYPAIWAFALGILFLGCANILRLYTKTDRQPDYWNKTFMVCAIILGILWTYWYVRIGMWDYWTDEYEAERLKAPAIALDFEEIHYGMSQKEVNDLFSGKGLRMRCYSDIRPNEGIEKSDTHTCWTIAHSVWDIPSKMIGFTFGRDGLRHIKVDFFETEQERLIHHLRDMDGEYVGEFGRDQGGNRVVSIMMEHGLLTTTRANNMPSATLLWSARERIEKMSCIRERLTRKQRQIMCEPQGQTWRIDDLKGQL